MRPISRTALGAATAAVLAVTAVVPSAADEPSGPGKRPIVGSGADRKADQRPVTVTLVTGDTVLVTGDGSGAAAATALPREDGTLPRIQTRQNGTDLYVYPEGAVSALAAGRVDRELFNVTGLIRQGYDDAHAKSLPLIAVYGPAATARLAPATPRGATRGLALPSVGGVALKADKKRAADFWADITGTPSANGVTPSANGATARATSRPAKLWLDRKVRATLDRSTKQVGAPAAWAAGYDGKGTRVAVLDTGADAEHPDLKGRITAQRNFTDSESTDDRQGHGTHTISTVGGSGAASGGRKKGVAPGADLLNGKVLNDSGYGETSWIIAGMQWAVDNGADVVSMSLGSPEPTDCTDPMSVAAEELAQSKGTLFVVAAGNAGPSLNTVSSPGCAPSVLTVGAVDRDDTTAPFSSTGPAIDAGHTLKPEIAAPGVAISAAAAGGRGKDAYQSMSGTSMATPHVAGAAAILKQRHPKWTAQQLKAALVSSAARTPGDVRQTGAGRLDVKAAIDATVTGAPALQGGTFNWPQDSSDRTTVRVPYTNSGAKPVTLSLAVEDVTGNDGSRVRSAVARIGKHTVTVPAGATVEVPLALDPKARLDSAQYGDVTGRVTATARGVRVSTPFSLYVEPRTVTLRVKLIDRTGKPADGPSSLDLIGTDTSSGERRFNDGATDQVYRLRPGAYFVSSFVESPDLTLSYLARPQFDLKGDTTLVLDARKAHRLGVRTEDRATETRSATLAFGRTWDDTWLHAGSISGNRLATYYADVQGRAKDGTFGFGSYWRAYAPQIESMRIAGGAELHPVVGSGGSENLDGSGETRVVDAGEGTPQELAAADVKGRIALVRAPADGRVGEQAEAAKDAGAKALLLHRPAPGRWLASAGFTGGPLPVLTVEAAEAKRITDALAKGETKLRWKATASSPYVYNLAFPEDGPVTSARNYRVRDAKLGRNTSTYRAMGVAADYLDLLTVPGPGGAAVSASALDVVKSPSSRTEFYTPGGTGWDHMVSSSFPYGELLTDPRRVYRAGQQRTESWYGGVVAPGAPRDETGRAGLAGERQGNVIGAAPAFWADSERIGVAGSFGDIGGMVLKRDGEEIGRSSYPFGAFEVPAADGAYELTLNTMKFGIPSRVWKRSTQTVTSWRFRSALDESSASQGLPLLFPGYSFAEDGLKTLPAADGQRIRLTATGHAGYQPGALTAAKLSYSYDDGETWTEAKTARQSGAWTATVNHAGADGSRVTLRTELTDSRGNSVIQTVTSAYAVR